MARNRTPSNAGATRLPRSPNAVAPAAAPSTMPLPMFHAPATACALFVAAVRPAHPAPRPNTAAPPVLTVCMLLVNQSATLLCTVLVRTLPTLGCETLPRRLTRRDL